MLTHQCMYLSGGRSEADAIEDITCTILQRLSQKLLHVEKNVIGMGSRLVEIILQIIDPLPNDVCMVGIY